MEEEEKKETNKLVLIAVPLVIVAIIIAAVLFLHHSNNSNLFKDGTYTAEGDYVTHVGPKKISVKVTLKNDLITDATVTNEADDAMSVKYQDEFISGFKDQVIGKNISDVKVTKVSGSSLTPLGFNKALQDIEAQAKM